MKKINAISLSLVFAFICNTSIAEAKDEAMATRIQQQLKADGRDKYDAVKDDGRKPVEVMQFMGVEEGMTVLEVMAGAGYNAEILSAAVGPNGIVYAQNPHFILRLANGERNVAMMKRLYNDRLPNVKYIIVDFEDIPFGEIFDRAFWGMNLHDIYNREGEAGTIQFLIYIRQILKPGGLLAVSDHVGEAGNDNAELHRIEPAIMKDMLQKAGFIIDATSDVLGNPKDDHSQSIYADDLRYYTDRILIKAKKPF